MSQPLTLLLVDDEENNHIFVKRRAGAEWAVESAYSAEEALARLRSGPLPALILADLNMPGGSGLDLARAIRADPALAALKMRIVTAVEPPPDTYAALRALRVTLFDKGKLSSRELPASLRATLEEPL